MHLTTVCLRQGITWPLWQASFFGDSSNFSFHHSPLSGPVLGPIKGPRGRVCYPLVVNLPEREFCLSPPFSSVLNTTGNYTYRNSSYFFLLTFPLNYQLVNANFWRYGKNGSEAKPLLSVSVRKASYRANFWWYRKNYSEAKSTAVFQRLESVFPF